MTHQEIIDRREAIARERYRLIMAQQAKFDAESRSLEELCGGIGHIHGDAPFFNGGGRCCVVCGAREGVGPAS